MIAPVNREMLVDRCDSIIWVCGQFPSRVELKDYTYWLGSEIGEKFDRYYKHNPDARLMVTTPEEMADAVISEWPDLVSTETSS